MIWALLLPAALLAAEPRPHENWKIKRGPAMLRALAVPAAGATINGLGSVVGLEPNEWRYWLKAPDKVRLADGTAVEPYHLQAWDKLAGGQRFYVPNVVAALWIGDLGEFGKWAVSWKADLEHLEGLGFRVLRLNKPKERGAAAMNKYFSMVEQAVALTARESALHGVFVTSHGTMTYIGDGTGEAVMHHRYLRGDYRLGLAIINACDGGFPTAKDLAARNGIFHGVCGLMIPILQTGSPDDFLKPGDQGTIKPEDKEKPSPAARRRHRKTS